MKALKLIAPLLILTTFMLHTAEAQDWANLNRYKAANETLKAPAANEQRVVFMGNSITEAWVSISPDFFKENPYIGRGISGQTTPQMLVRFRADVIDLKPKVVVILAGTNDIAGNTGPMTLEMIFGNLKSMAELARANGIAVVLSSVLPVYDYPWKPGLEPAQKIVKLNAMIKTYAQAQDMVYLDYFTSMADDRDGLKNHWEMTVFTPNKAGYDIMEPLAKEAIASALASK